MNHIVVVIDRSGSMGAHSQDTIEWCNTLISSNLTKTVLTLVLFDYAATVVYKSMPIAEAPLLTRDIYYDSAECGTSLLDAIGTAIELALDYEKRHMLVKTAIVLFSDCKESSSHEYQSEYIRNKIRQLEEGSCWDFICTCYDPSARSAILDLGIKESSILGMSKSAG